MVIEGYPIIFNEVDFQNDIMSPDLIIVGDMPKMLLEHAHPEIGKWIEISRDDRGYKIIGEVVNQWVVRSIKHRWRSGLSIGFRTLAASYDHELKVRRVQCIELLEVSIVATPAVPGAHLKVTHPHWLATA